MTTQKKIEYGSASSIVQGTTNKRTIVSMLNRFPLDLSEIYTTVFDHKAALQDEQKYFIREFEVRSNYFV